MSLEAKARFNSRTILELDCLNAHEFADVCCYCLNQDLKLTIDDCWFNEGRHFICISIDVTGKTLMAETLLKTYLKHTK